jgi:hypothetical protein
VIVASLSHYRIIEKPSTGGMGAFCRANETIQDRQAAVKVRPEVFACDPGRMAQFEQIQDEHGRKKCWPCPHSHHVLPCEMFLCVDWRVMSRAT